MFADRAHAGRALGEALRGRDLTRPIVLAAPRGGAPVGAEIARALGCELDVVLVRKLRHPRQEELAIGAIGEAGAIALNERIAETVDRAALEQEIARRRGELTARSERYRAARPAADVRDRDVILVDDGVATGATLQAAIDVVRRRGPRRIIVAIPVAPAETLDRLKRSADDVICLQTPTKFQSVAQFYDTFAQTLDDEVVSLLNQFGSRDAATE